MGNTSAAMYSRGGGGGGSPRSKLQLNFPKVVITNKLGGGKFLKSYRCKAGGVGYVIKVFLGREPNGDILEWCEYFAKELAATCSALDPINHPNLLPYQRWMLSMKKPGYQRGSQPQQVYLIREYVISNLYDRLSTRPFLTWIEKCWIVFQLLKALSQCHSAGICHGDLKSENILVTSFNWVFLTDFAPFKPTYILDDDPAEFYYYFQSQNRARCYIAPERFYSSSGNDTPNFSRDDEEEPGGGVPKDDKVGGAAPSDGRVGDTLEDDLVKVQPSMSPSTNLPHESSDNGENTLLSPDHIDPVGDKGGAAAAGAVSSSSSKPSEMEDRERERRVEPLTEAMDIFSLGCVIAEIFLDGEPLMDLPDVLHYRSAGANADASSDRQPVFQKLDKVSDLVVRKLILHMLSRDPHERKTAQEYLNRMVKNEALFPSYFEGFLYPFMSKLQTSTTTPDERLELICANYGEAMKYLVGIDDEEGCKFFDVRIRLRNRCKGKLKRVDDENMTRPSNKEKKGGGVDDDDETTAGSSGTENNQQQQDCVAQNARRKNEEDNLKEVSNQERQRSSSKEDDDDMYSGIWSEGLDELLRKSSALLEDMGYGRSSGGGLGSEGIGGGTNNGGCQKGTSVKQHATSPDSQTSFGKAKTEGLPPVSQPIVSEGLIFLAQVVCSTIQHLGFPQNRVLALCLLSRFGRHCDDEARLQRLIPYVMALLEDPAPIVRATAVRCLRSLLLRVGDFPASDEDLFPLYIFPALQRLPLDSEELVRVAFAECLPTLAETSKKFLDTTCTTKLSRALSSAGSAMVVTASNQNDVDSSRKEGSAEGTEAFTTLINTKYDSKLSVLRKYITRWFILLLSSSDQHLGTGSISSVTTDAAHDQFFSTPRVGKVLNFPPPCAKLALLREMPRLCVFFGQESTLNSLLPQLIAMLNDRDWTLRAAFCEHIPTVCAFVGHIATAEFILPCVENALMDSEEFVTCKAVLCLESLLKLGLLSRHYILDLLPESIVPLLIHPGAWLREATLNLVASVAVFLGPLDVSIFLLPILAPYLRYSLDVWGEGKLTVALLKKAIRPPISKVTFQMAAQALIDQEGGCMSPSSSSSFNTGFRPLNTTSKEQQSFPIFHPIKGVENNEFLRQLTSPQVPIDKEEQKQQQMRPPFSSSCDGMIRCLKRYVQASAVPQPMTDSERVVLMRWYGSASHKNIVPEACSAARRWKEHAICLPIGSFAMSSPRSNEVELLLMRGKEAVQEAVLANPLLLSEAMGIRSVSVEGATNTGGVDEATRSALVHEGRGIRSSSLSLSVIADYLGVSDEMVLAERTVALGVPPLPPPLNEAGGGIVKCESKTSGSSTDEARNNSMSGQANIISVTQTLDTMSGVDFLSSIRYQYQSLNSLQGTTLNHKRISVNQEGYYDGGDEGGNAGPKPYFGSGDRRRKKVSQAELERGWKYRRGVLMTSLRAHSSCVNRLAIASDGSYFVSCSSDGTSCVWEVKGIENRKNLNPQPQVRYSGQHGHILDVCVIEGSQALATVSSEGSVHVWRVETTFSNPPSGPVSLDKRNSDESYGFSSQGIISTIMSDKSESRCGQGATLVRQVEIGEGPIVNVTHMESASASTSMLVYATQMGGIRSWDLRDSKEPWKIQTPPELGAITSVAAGNDKMWFCVGTTRGFLTMYDLRFPIGLSVWRHSSRSPLHCLSTCCRIPCWESPSTAAASSTAASRANIFISAGDDVAVWDLNDGPFPLHCFRVDHGFQQAAEETNSSGDEEMSPETANLPRLDPIPLPFHPRARLLDAAELLKAVSGSVQNPPPYSSIRAMTGKISYSSYSYLITGGTDRCIRCWDLDVPSRCYTISGPPGPIGGMGGSGKRRDVQMQTFHGGSRLTTFFSNCTPSGAQQPIFTPLVHQKGLNQMPAMHADAITDLKVKAGGKNAERILLSSSRDGVVNVWG